MIQVTEITTPDKLEVAFAIRKKVFIEEQKVSEEEEYDEFESTSYHVLAILEGIPVGTARMRSTEKGFKLERFSVLSEFRGKGVGTSLVKKLLVVCKNKPETRVYLYAQVDAIGFYEKFGFETIGNIFQDARIDHIEMQYNEKRKAN